MLGEVGAGEGRQDGGSDSACHRLPGHKFGELRIWQMDRKPGVLRFIRFTKSGTTTERD